MLNVKKYQVNLFIDAVKHIILVDITEGLFFVNTIDTYHKQPTVLLAFKHNFNQ